MGVFSYFLHKILIVVSNERFSSPTLHSDVPAMNRRIKKCLRLKFKVTLYRGKKSTELGNEIEEGRKFSKN